MVVPPHNDIEMIWILFKILSSDVVINAVYIPPNANLLCFEKYCQNIEFVSSCFSNYKIILTRDFNLPCLKDYEFEF